MVFKYMVLRTGEELGFDPGPREFFGEPEKKPGDEHEQVLACTCKS